MSGGWILCGPDETGLRQMDLDRRMLAAAEQDGLTRIRLYHFVPPAISLGFHQKESDIDKAAASEHGIDVVRRPTGGRAVLHKGDIVYSIATGASGVGEQDPLHIGVYNRVSRALLAGFRSLGLPAEASQDKPHALRSGDLPKLCFSSATRHEVQIDNRKMVGSAQRRGRGAVLQHGSILVTDEHLELVDLLAGLDDGKRERLRSAMEKRTVSLREGGLTATLEELRLALCEAFQAEFPGIEQLEPDQILDKLEHTKVGETAKEGR